MKPNHSWKWQPLTTKAGNDHGQGHPVRGQETSQRSILVIGMTKKVVGYISNYMSMVIEQRVEILLNTSMIVLLMKKLGKKPVQSLQLDQI